MSEIAVNQIIEEIRQQPTEAMSLDTAIGHFRLVSAKYAEVDALNQNMSREILGLQNEHRRVLSMFTRLRREYHLSRYCSKEQADLRLQVMQQLSRIQSTELLQGLLRVVKVCAANQEKDVPSIPESHPDPCIKILSAGEDLKAESEAKEV